MILDVFDRPGDERRLQGLFAHAWRGCLAFRDRFAARLEWPEAPESIREEVNEKSGHRADLVIGSDEGFRRVVELKVWHTLSDAQRKAAREGGLDVVIVPKRRLTETRAELRGAKAGRIAVLTWQEVEALAHGTPAELLLSGVGDWLEDGTILKAAAVPTLLAAREKGETPRALLRFLSAVEEAIDDASRFEVTGRTWSHGKKVRYFGVDVTYHRGSRPHGLWTGWLWTPGRKEVCWVVQDCEARFAPSRLPAFAVSAQEYPGLVVWSPAAGDLDAEAIARSTLAAMWQVMGLTPPS